MDQARKKIPAEAVDLYTQFIHGDISRRAFMDGLKRFAAFGLTAGALADALMPNYALGQQIRKDDERIETSYVVVPSPDGQRLDPRLLHPPEERRHPRRDPRPSCRRCWWCTRTGASIRTPRTCAPLRAGELHGLRAGRPDLGGRLSGRRLQGRPGVQQDRQGQADEGLGGRRPLAEGAPGLHRQGLRHRLLLRRRGVQTPWPR
ncbi:MAG: hypothetical protein WDN45_15365 [Caulobacteraceae bacterium]